MSGKKRDRGLPYLSFNVASRIMIASDYPREAPTIDLVKSLAR
jgi:hypothetical protein